MLICKNCFTENPDGTVRCNQCNMEGNFILKLPDTRKPATLIREENKVQCRNCGSPEPGTGKKCMHCHFPMISVPQRVHPLNSQEFNNLKIG